MWQKFFMAYQKQSLLLWIKLKHSYCTSFTKKNHLAKRLDMDVRRTGFMQYLATLHPKNLVSVETGHMFLLVCPESNCFCFCENERQFSLNFLLNFNKLY